MSQIETIIAKAVRPAYSDFPPSIDAVSVAVLADLDAAGFVVVPKEPTKEMVTRGAIGGSIAIGLFGDEVKGAYRAMIEARPK